MLDLSFMPGAWAAMFIAADPISNFVNATPAVIMLALSFLSTIGVVLVADGFGVHVPEGYIHAAMAFASFVEFLDILSRRRRARARAAG